MYSAAGNLTGGMMKGSGRSGTSGSLAQEPSFADLLKKLLPGGDEAAKRKDAGADSIAMGDRAPASDQAAVIGRNKNIFDEVHKRYQLKAQQKAVF